MIGDPFQDVGPLVAHRRSEQDAALGADLGRHHLDNAPNVPLARKVPWPVVAHPAAPATHCSSSIDTLLPGESAEMPRTFSSAAGRSHQSCRMHKIFRVV